MHKLTVCDGKYTFVCNEHFGVEEVLRYNEEWTSNINPLNAVSALCSELYEAWAERDALKEVLRLGLALKLGAYPAHGSGFVAILTEGDLDGFQSRARSLLSQPQAEGEG